MLLRISLLSIPGSGREFFFHILASDKLFTPLFSRRLSEKALYASQDQQDDADDYRVVQKEYVFFFASCCFIHIHIV